MDPQLSIICVILIGLVSQSLAQSTNSSTNVYCYDCDPKNNPEACANPVRNGVKQTLCNQLPRKHENSTFICLSANITFYGHLSNETGIYRGCQEQEASVESFCDYFKEETDNNNTQVVSCVPCNTTRCNNITFRADGSPDDNSNNGSSFVDVTLMVIIVSVLFSVFF
ncbi:unnamed protein product [Ceutorhynchus assimilis]|uniref:Protein quiver n=1 Tax=Ceutorhynchus assimilis TaxID=467358 RepID=A0A9N9QQ06_9CUCU|nr:unnamed protein product [Ceutorhynchus assimilis]